MGAGRIRRDTAWPPGIVELHGVVAVDRGVVRRSDHRSRSRTVSALRPRRPLRYGGFEVRPWTMGATVAAGVAAELSESPHLGGGAVAASVFSRNHRTGTIQLLRCYGAESAALLWALAAARRRPVRSQRAGLRRPARGRRTQRETERYSDRCGRRQHGHTTAVAVYGPGAIVLARNRTLTHRGSCED